MGERVRSIQLFQKKVELAMIFLGLTLFGLAIVLPCFIAYSNAWPRVGLIFLTTFKIPVDASRTVPLNSQLPASYKISVNASEEITAILIDRFSK